MWLVTNTAENGGKGASTAKSKNAAASRWLKYMRCPTSDVAIFVASFWLRTNQPMRAHNTVIEKRWE